MRKICAFWLTLIMIVVLVAMAAGTDYIDRVLFMLAAAVVACVWMACEASVERVQTPIIIREEPEKPPEEKEP